MVEIIKGEHVHDGAGVKLYRIIGSRALSYVDPFMLLDEFKSDNEEDYVKGFPMHPHRGIETVTYMVEGKFHHKDSKGNEGDLSQGELQWMRAGRGILHEEMPSKFDGRLWGYQLWINLAKKDKMTTPKYQHIKSDQIKSFRNENLQVKVISGEYEGVFGPHEGLYPVDYFDIWINNNSHFFKHTHRTTIIYVYEGELNIKVNNEKINVKEGQLCILKDEDSVSIYGDDVGALYMSADPHDEPIARGGPFVMNTKAEIMQAFKDYENGTLQL